MTSTKPTREAPCGPSKPDTERIAEILEESEERVRRFFEGRETAQRFTSLDPRRKKPRTQDISTGR